MGKTKKDLEEEILELKAVISNMSAECQSKHIEKRVIDETTRKVQNFIGFWRSMTETFRSQHLTHAERRGVESFLHMLVLDFLLTLLHDDERISF